MLAVYQINKSLTNQIASELAERRAQRAGRHLAGGYMLRISILGNRDHNRIASTRHGPAQSMREAFGKYFKIGASLNSAQFSGRDPRGEVIAKTHFDTITSENILKWESVHPSDGKYDFEGPDKYVAFGETNKMFIVGHTLVWHNQTPKWVFEDASGKPVTRDVLLGRFAITFIPWSEDTRDASTAGTSSMKRLNEDGTLRQSQWFKIIGDDYIEKAFQFAHAADPKAELYYNDYSLENAAKRKGAIELVRNLLKKGIPVTAVGSQSHHKMDWPSMEEQDRTISELSALGVKVAITELDIDVLPRASDYSGADITVNYELQAKLNPFKNGLPEDQQKALAERYGAIFKIFLKHHKVIDRVTFWCVTDGDSWLNDWPVRGRTNYPLLFDRAGKPKPAFSAVLQTAINSKQK